MLSNFDLQKFAEPSGNWSNFTEDLPEAVNNVIQIITAGQLAKLAENVNNGISSYSGYTVELLNDIDLSAHDWTPIGTDKNNSFKGTFDGRNQP